MSDPFKITEPTVVSFSGGRSSAYMLWRVLQSNNGLPEEAKAIFCNTGKEVEETLKFVKDCETNWKVKIDWVEYRSESPGYAFVDFETASRKGEPFEQLILKKQYLPNTFARFCTQELKINLIKDLEPLANPQLASAMVQGLIQSPLNADNRLLIFAAQSAPELVEKLKKLYKYGIRGDSNDIEQFVSYINKYYSERRNMSDISKKYFMLI